MKKCNGITIFWLLACSRACVCACACACVRLYARVCAFSCVANWLCRFGVKTVTNHEVCKGLHTIIDNLNAGRKKKLININYGCLNSPLVSDPGEQHPEGGKMKQHLKFGA